MRILPDLKGKCEEMAKFYRAMGAGTYLSKAGKYERYERLASESSLKRISRAPRILFDYHVAYSLERRLDEFLDKRLGKPLGKVFDESLDAFLLWTSLELSGGTGPYKEARKIQGLEETEVFKAVRAVEQNSADLI